MNIPKYPGAVIIAHKRDKSARYQLVFTGEWWVSESGTCMIERKLDGWVIEQVLQEGYFTPEPTKVGAVVKSFYGGLFVRSIGIHGSRSWIPLSNKYDSVVYADIIQPVTVLFEGES